MRQVLAISIFVATMLMASLAFADPITTTLDEARSFIVADTFAASDFPDEVRGANYVSDYVINPHSRRADPVRDFNAYVTFDFSNITGNHIVSAFYRFRNEDGQCTGADANYSFYYNNYTIDETTLTWNNQPYTTETTPEVALDCEEFPDFSTYTVDVTKTVQKALDLNGGVFTFFINVTNPGEGGVTDLKIISKEYYDSNGGYTVEDIHFLNITYDDATTGPLTLLAEKDSFLRQGNDDRNEGANPRMIVQASGNNRAVAAFEKAAIDGFVAGGLTKATLVLTIADNADNWGQQNDRTVDAHPLNVVFTEGNGQNAGVPLSQSTRGSGPGVTWNCAVDTEIANQQTDCGPTWNGGDFGAATASSQLHINGQSGAVEWDVTQDVLNGVSGWLIKKTNEGQSGMVGYYSREGANDVMDMSLAPKLILE